MFEKKGIVIAIVIAAVSLATSVSFGQGSQQIEEQSIRRATYEFSFARSTGNVEAFKTYAAQRSLDLFGLLFEVLPDINGIREQFTKKGIVDAQGFLKDSLAAIKRGAEMDGMQLVDLQNEAKERSEGNIIFTGARDATITFKVPVTTRMLDGKEVKSTRDKYWRAVFENNRWKIDDTDRQKEILLQLPLTPESLRRIKTF